jgi:4'-phosphopantetheinyl transferase EntD
VNPVPASRPGAEGHALIQAIAPGPAVVYDTREDSPDAQLFPDETEKVANAVDSRRREFTTGRECARRAMGQLGVPPRSVPTGPRGEPQWPRGIVGSITHCKGYRGAVVGRSVQITTIGIDAEPNEPLPEGVLAAIGLPQEQNWVDRLLATAPQVRWDRLLFCGKEAVYKAWYPLARSWLDFDDALITVDQEHETFTARLRVAGPVVNGRATTGFSGRWLVRDSLVLTAIVLPERAPAVARPARPAQHQAPAGGGAGPLSRAAPAGARPSPRAAG